MATINLLPWRDELRQEKTREFFSVLVLLVILASLICYVWFAYVQAEVTNQRARNALLQKEIDSLSQQVAEIEKLKSQRADLESKMLVIQNLQNERPLIVHYFDEIVRVVPDGIYLRDAKRSGSSINITGSAESNNRVSTLMRNIDQSEYFKSPNLKSVVKEGFELEFETDSPEQR